VSGTLTTGRAPVVGRRWSAPKLRAWFVGSSAAAGALVLAYAAAAFLTGVTPTRGAGLVFGILAAVLLGMCMALSLRKRFKHLRLGRTLQWLQFHIYGGGLFLLLVFLHIGFTWPSGFLTWALFLLTLLVSLSGVAGAWLQKWIPHTLAQGLHVEAIYERIPELVGKLRAEAEGIVKGSSQTLLDFYRAELATSLGSPQPSMSFLMDVTGGRQQRMALFIHVASRLSAAEKEKLTDLRQILVEKTALDAQLSLQRLMRAWLYLHVPASTVLLAFVLVHIGAVIYY